MVGFQHPVGGGWHVVNSLGKQGSEIKGLICLLKLEEPLEFKQKSDIIRLHFRTRVPNL